MSNETPDIPDVIQEMMQDKEVENMRNLDGWAVGTVVLIEMGSQKQTIHDAWIELFNGEGCAGEFGGVRFMGKNGDGRYQEAYAYGTEEAMDHRSTGWYVESYDYPDDPNVGDPAP